MAELIFTTAPKTYRIPDVTFTLDDHEYTAHAPKRAAWGQLIHAMTNATADSFYAVMVFLDACLDPSEQMIIEQRLRSRTDDLDIEDLLNVVQALQEEWEPHIGDEFAELTGNREQRRAADRKQPQDRTPAKRLPARKTPARA